jgi:small GTP-binding protein
MTPVLAIIGRPNVGKSTLFNQLTKSRDALVADTPGMTRDRIVGHGSLGERRYLCVDTGGLGETTERLAALVRAQTLCAAAEADVVLFVVDGRAGMAAGDRDIACCLRRLGKPVRIAVNKTGISAATTRRASWCTGIAARACPSPTGVISSARCARPWGSRVPRCASSSTRTPIRMRINAPGIDPPATGAL